MLAEPVIMGNDRREVRKALRKVYGSAFVPKTFDFCIVGTLESIESVVIPDSVNVEMCIDPECDTAVRFVRLKAVNAKPVQMALDLAA